MTTIVARPITGAAWLTRSTLNSIKQKSLLIEIDQDFLAQIQRILPAELAGFCVWTGECSPAVWVKWHWYFDADLKQFVVPPNGITSNVVLVAHAGGASLPDAVMARHALRRIRRRHDWKPWVHLHQLRRQPRPTPVAPLPTWPPPTRSAPPPAPADPDLGTWEQEELSIMRLVRAGHRRKQISSELSISTATVDRRLANIKARLGVSSNKAIGEAAAWRGLI